MLEMQYLIVNNYSLKWRWLAVDIYRAAKQRGKYPTLATNTDHEVNSCFVVFKKLIWMFSSLVTDANRDAFSSRVGR